MCMYTCTYMSCIYTMSWIHRYMYMSVRSPSRHHLACCQQRRWQYQRFEIFVWESRGNWGSWTSSSCCSFWEPRSCQPNRPTFLWPLKKKSSLLFWREKKSWFRNEWSLTCPLQGGHYRNRKGRELRERDGSHNRSRFIYDCFYYLKQ